MEKFLQGFNGEQEFEELAKTHWVFEKWERIPIDPRQRLEKAVKLAPIIVEDALQALRQHLVYDEPTRTSANWQAFQALPSDPGQTQTGMALTKYFNLHAVAADKATYWRYVRGIIEVYSKIALGLNSNLELVIEYLPTSAGAVVNSNPRTRAVSPIRQIFGFADEYGHVEWTVNTGDPHRIKIGSRYMCDPTTRPEDLARTIVHEASHKFARTKDILYKHSSFAKDLDLFVEAPDAQQGLARSSRPDKTLQPMTGFADRAAKTIIHAERYLENADSYAWMARRLWKKRGSRGK